MTQLSHKMSDNQSIKTPASNRSNELITLFATVIALQLSPLQAQTTESTRLLERGESPRSVLVKKDAVHTDTKPGANGTTWTVRSSVEASSPSATLQATKGYGQMVDTPFGRLSFAEIAGLSAEKKEKSINGMTRMEKIAFKEWELQIANQKVAVSQSELIKKKEVRKGINEELINEEVRIENDKKELITKKEVRKGINEELIKEKNEGKRLEGELIKTYYAYVANIEAGASGERAVLEKMFKKEFTPTDLKERIESLLSRKDLKLALR